MLRPARYVDETEEVEFGEVHVFVGPDFVLTVRHSEAPDLAAVRRRLESQPDLLRRGPEAVLYAILDRVVDGYYPVVAGLGNDIDEIETEVFSGDPQVSRRIYELSREVTEFQRATRPLTEMLAALTAGFAKYGIDDELQRYLRDVDDHLTQVDRARRRVPSAAARHAHRQRHPRRATAERGDEEPRRGQQHPERGGEEDLGLGRDPLRPDAHRHRLRHELRPHARAGLGHGYPLALFLMVLTCVTLYTVFKRRNWL